MKAAVLDAPGGPPESFRIDPAHPDPIPEEHEALVQVTATSINYLDIWVRRGIKGVSVPFPHICGADISGSVEGDRVLVLPGVSCGACRYCRSGRDSLCPSYQILGVQRQGGYAERVAVPRRNLFPIPDGWSDAEAAAFPLVYLTAWHALRERARAGVDVLVWGASGGVGVAAIQLAKLLGATVAAATGSADKADVLRDIGADLVAVGSPEEVEEAVEAGFGGVDCVVDSLGAGVIGPSLRLLRPGGTIVSVGDNTGSDASLHIPTVARRELTFTGSFMGSRVEFEDLLRVAASGALHPLVWRTVPLDAVSEAHHEVEGRRHVGKVVLTVA